MGQREEKMSNKWRLTLFIGSVIVGFLLIFRYFPAVIYLLFGGATFAYLVYPMVKHFERKSLKPVAAICLSYAILSVIFAFFIFVILPILYRESMGLLQNAELFYDYFTSLRHWLMEKANNFVALSQIFDWQRDIVPVLDDEIMNAIYAIVERLMKLPKGLTYCLFSPFIAYYFLRDMERIGGVLITIFPPRHRSNVLILARQTNRVVSGFIRGNLLVSLAVAAFTTIGLCLIGVDYPLLLGILAGIFDLIPYFGPILGAIPVLLIALMQPQVNLLLVVLLLVAVQQLENIFISPKIIGDCVGLHPVSIILLVFVGGSLGGIMGMVLIIPLAAIVKVLAIFLYERFVGYRFH